MTPIVDVAPQVDVPARSRRPSSSVATTFLILVVAGGAACGGSPRMTEAAGQPLRLPGELEMRPGHPATPSPLTITVIGTNDIHGHIAAFPTFAGYVSNLRAERVEGRGRIILVDAGDMIQGTLPSAMTEGAAVIHAMNAVGYTAAAVGNHDFDFGPVGPASTASEGEDPRGALRARALAANFPILTANLADASGQRVDWPNMPLTLLIHHEGIGIGLIGVSTEERLTTTLRANVANLRMTVPSEMIVREAERLRQGGAAVVIVLAHAGGDCRNVVAHDDLRAATKTKNSSASRARFGRGWST